MARLRFGRKHRSIVRRTDNSLHVDCLPSLACTALLLLSGCADPDAVIETATPVAEFAGSPACESCHQAQFDDWQGSHHQLAMQIADDESVLGDFTGATFDYFGALTRFSKKDGAFVVETGDQLGHRREYTVSHTFGVTPLQQYLVEFPDGRKQALPFLWDARSEDAGGQRWYHLYADENILPGDPLHWTGRLFNWNTMCAECHSTDVDLDYQLDTDTFSTTYSELSVGCEACHGPGATHIAQAKRDALDSDYGLAVNLDDRGDTSWIMNTDTGIAELSSRRQQQQVESCGRCHSRRSVLTADYQYGKMLTDTHMPSLLDENLYRADGRILDEVYVYGSFLQSKMYDEGVTCTDCHNPHSGRLATGNDPNSICAQCHLPEKFANSGHSKAQSTACVDCHMQSATYMGVDDRRDHSFRLPGTDADESHFGAIVAAGRRGGANSELIDGLATPDYPDIAKATMLTLFSAPMSNDAVGQVSNSVDDPNPLVRIAALRTLRRLPPESTARLSGSHLLRDPVRAVRVEAALTFIELRDLLPLEDARAYPAAADEYRAAQLAAAGMPESLTLLGEFESRTGNAAAANRYFEYALKLDPDFAVARHSYGLWLVRNGRSHDALDHLRRAAELQPSNSRYVYVLGVALNSLGHAEEALTLLQKALRDFPDNFDIAWALATMLRDHGDFAAARMLAREMSSQYPDNHNIQMLLQSLANE